MKKFWNPVVETAEDLQKAAVRLIDGGVKFFQGHLGRIPLFSSSEVLIGQGNPDRDETHYFMVPNRSEESGYCLYTVRVLPEGVGPENDLPKAKIFQLPGDGTEDRLTELLLGELRDDAIERSDVDSPLADRLDLIATEIDKQCNLVSGGLLLVGGVVAVANPLLGAGIAAQALLPGIGSKLSVHGIRHASDWFRNRREKSVVDDAEKNASVEVKKLKPEMRVNPILKVMETALSSSADSYDPWIESQSLYDDLNEIRDVRLGAQALVTVYSRNNGSELDPGLRSWIDSLETINS